MWSVNRRLALNGYGRLYSSGKIGTDFSYDEMIKTNDGSVIIVRQNEPRKFNPLCKRCKNHGTLNEKQRKFCDQHCYDEKCYRFTLDR